MSWGKGLRRVGAPAAAGQSSATDEDRRGTAHRARRSTRHIRRRLALGLSLVTALAVFGVLGGVPWSPLEGPASSGAAPVCQSDGNLGCTGTIPCPTAPCPSVDVTPATGLRDGQYMFITSQNFPSTDSMRVAVCSTNSSQTDPSCLNGDWEEDTWYPISVPITDDPTQGNETTVSYPAFDDPSESGNTPLPAHDITNEVGSVPGFFCGDAADPCEIVITDESGQGNSVGNGPPVSSSNSVIIPITFAAESNGCPASDPTVDTDSSFSLEHFLPVAVDATCTGSNGVIGLNTATDNDTVISDFVNGGDDISFVDNPSDVSELATLAGHSYAFIPVALSGTVVSFLAGDSLGPVSYPVATYKLTPNMVAGLITSLYQFPAGTIEFEPKEEIALADNLVPPLSCANLVGCKARNKVDELENEQPYNSFDLLNPVTEGVTAPVDLGTFLSNVPSGASYQVTDWLCNAPNDPFNVQVNEVTPPAGQSNPVTVSIQDPNSASTTFTTAPLGSSIWPPYTPPPPWVFPTCQGYATLPALSGTAANFSESQSPALQAKYMRGWSYGGGSLPSPPDSQTPLAAFGVMDSSEAAFYGLNDATLQNASGDFVPLTTTSLEDGADDLTPCPTDLLSCPAGTYAMNYDSTSLATDPSAYPMPNVTYAVVPTDPQPASTATAEKDLLTNLVNFSYSDASQLPAGYAPLPKSLYEAAVNDIADDLVAEPVTGNSSGSGSSSTGGSSPTSSTGSSSSGTGSSTASGQGATGAEAGPFGSVLPATAPSASSSPSKSNSSREPTATAALSSSTTPLGSIRLALDNAARYLLPGLLALAGACLLIGPAMLLWPAIRRRRR